MLYCADNYSLAFWLGGNRGGAACKRGVGLQARGCKQKRGGAACKIGAGLHAKEGWGCMQRRGGAACKRGAGLHAKRGAGLHILQTQCSAVYCQDMMKCAATPSALGSTTLPKVALSFKWTIDNASVLAQTTSKAFSLTSPVFTVQLPLRSPPSLESPWSLLIEKVEKEPYRTSIYLCQGGEMTTCPKSKSKVLISACTFSIMNPKTGEEKYRTGPVDKACTLGLLRRCVQSFLDNNHIKECLFDDKLTIQVKANLFCIADPKETVDHVCTVPQLSDLQGEMHSLYKDGVFTDAALKCKSKEFKVHRAVLASRSPVFRKMFEVDTKEKKCGVVMIDDFDPPVLSDLVTYLYTGTAPNVGKLAKELLNAANKYELTRLFAICESELEKKIKVVNAVDTLLLAVRHSAVNLKKACLDFIYQHSIDVYMTSKWKNLKDNLDQYAKLVIEVMEYRP